MLKLKKISKRARRQMQQAKGAPKWGVHIGAAKTTKGAREAHKTRQLGKLGAASPGRVLMKDGKPVDPET